MDHVHYRRRLICEIMGLNVASISCCRHSRRISIDEDETQRGIRMTGKVKSEVREKSEMLLDRMWKTAPLSATAS